MLWYKCRSETELEDNVKYVFLYYSFFFFLFICHTCMHRIIWPMITTDLEGGINGIGSGVLSYNPCLLVFEVLNVRGVHFI